MNWFVLAAGALYLIGAGIDVAKGNYVLTGIFMCYAFANFLG